jgi:hypothetical protein
MVRDLPVHRVVVMGDGGTGKTALTIQVQTVNARVYQTLTTYISFVSVTLFRLMIPPSKTSIKRKPSSMNNLAYLTCWTPLAKRNMPPYSTAGFARDRLTY